MSNFVMSMTMTICFMYTWSWKYRHIHVVEPTPLEKSFHNINRYKNVQFQSQMRDHYLLKGNISGGKGMALQEGFPCIVYDYCISFDTDSTTLTGLEAPELVNCIDNTQKVNFEIKREKLNKYANLP